MPELTNQAIAKRALDIACSVTGLLVMAPVLVLTAAAVRLCLGRPVVFRQTRAGLHGRPFTLNKFRTMRNVAGPDGDPLPDSDRLTVLGQFLRSSSIDELPALWNVLKGEMSLVGPRPLLLEYIPRYTPEQMRRHDVRPGITGWAQVHGRNAIPWEQKFAYDVWYVDNQSLWLDMKILCLTLNKVFRREGISHHGRATMDKFRGSRG